MHPYLFVLKLPLLVEIQQKVYELVFFPVTSYPAIIILEDTLI
jgi:hypothetical protein